ncbi:MAG: T9SS type A sorting domain-containing protein [Flavobacteriales bacterium]|nr:T9SS type A sorting domain-containing protein [Flavobacteriales bacterium]
MKYLIVFTLLFGLNYASILAQIFQKIDLNPNGSSNIKYLTQMNGSLYFYATDSLGSKGLWKSDGTLSGSFMIKELNIETPLFEMNGNLVFRAYDQNHNSELWISDGTSNGTYMIHDINGLTNTGSSIENLTVIDSLLYFRASDTIHGKELWVTDGTSSGTKLVADIYPGLGSSDPYYISSGGPVFFNASDAGVGTGGLFNYIGQTLTKVASDTVLGSPIYEINGYHIFSGSVNGDQELWQVDSIGNIQKLKNLNSSGTAWPSQFNLTSSMLYFSAIDSLGPGLWKSDGTTQGTSKIHNFSSLPIQSQLLNGNLIFSVNDSIHSGIWKSNTSAGNATPLKSGVYTNSAPWESAIHNGKLYFIGMDSTFNKALWVTDGTPIGTKKLVPTQAGFSRPFNYANGDFQSFAGDLYFTARYDTLDTELWKLSDFATDIDDFNNSGNSYAYPNPVKNHTYVGDHSSYELFDQTGHLIESSPINDGLINLSHVPNGLYLIRLDQMGKARKIIKQ